MFYEELTKKTFLEIKTLFLKLVAPESFDEPL
jgi:hypothetical protein